MDAEEMTAVCQLMAEYPQLWAVCGGWAIDLFLDRVTRPHKDIDLAILRRDQLIAQKYMLERGWTLQIAHNGELTTWQVGTYLELPLHTIWCKKDDEFVELLLNENEGQNFLFRRDTTIQLKFADAFLMTAEDIPFLAPEVVILYKANNPNDEGNRHDFFTVLPALDRRRYEWLLWALWKLNPHHEWLDVIKNWIDE